MDRATIERNLAQVERDLRAASEDIAHQHETLRNPRRHGEDTTEAVRSIGILEDTRLVLRALREHLPTSWQPWTSNIRQMLVSARRSDPGRSRPLGPPGHRYPLWLAPAFPVCQIFAP